MMNRIVLIGNGFDLAHGLPTSYKEFIEDYWTQYGMWLSGCLGRTVTDDLCTITLENEDTIWYHIIPHYPINGQKVPTPKEIIDEIKTCSEGVIVEKTPFFELIDKAIETKKWVDIENEYYLQLKGIIKSTPKIYDDPQKLDKEFDIIKSKLTTYLTTVKKEQIKPELVKDCIRKTIYEPFCAKDISNEGNESFRQFLIDRLEFLTKASVPEIDCFLNQFGQSFFSEHSNIDTYKDSIKYKKPIKNPSEPDTFDIQKHIRMVDDHQEAVPDCFLFPDQILFLNFNYTNTADLYITKNSGFTVNHIHGELENEKNPIIFGYGDELDDDYKEISKLNDNSYLTNIKSIRYLETDNYRRLLRFIDSAPYQIYIMGHSCGNSDRTLLNTIFEHKNCVSIKPYFYEKFNTDGTRNDNYIEIIQNISRNFNSMQKMRDRVVNKSYCRPLVPLAEQ